MHGESLWHNNAHRVRGKKSKQHCQSDANLPVIHESIEKIYHRDSVRLIKHYTSTHSLYESRVRVQVGVYTAELSSMCQPGNKIHVLQQFAISQIYFVSAFLFFLVLVSNVILYNVYMHGCLWRIINVSKFEPAWVYWKSVLLNCKQLIFSIDELCMHNRTQSSVIVVYCEDATFRINLK